MASKLDELEPLIEEVRRAAAAIPAGATVGLSERDRLVSAAQRLRIAADTPHEYLQEVRNQPIQNICIMMGIQIGLFKSIADGGRQGVSCADLSKRVKYSESVIWRIMRLMTSIGIGKEVGPATYQTNSILEALTTSPQVSGIHCMCVDIEISIFVRTELTLYRDGLMFPIGSKINEYMETCEFLEFRGPGQKGVLEFALGMPLWEAMRRDPRSKVVYDEYMSGRRAIVQDHWFDAFPVDQKLQGASLSSSDVLLVDIAGNTGHDITSFADRFAHLSGRLILQDLPETLNIIKDGSLGRVEKMEYDFFTPQPIKGARFYYMRNIIHDWSDERCKQLLANTVAAMDKEISTLLLDDWVLKDTDAPLLAATEDIMMLLVANGKERTRLEWDHLLSSVGLRIAQVWRSSEDRQAVIEAKKI
ncbi:MAG: hypothetical protein Q9162_002092 [Coniocarpon cinnabarinum]